MKKELAYLLVIFCLVACNSDTKQVETADTIISERIENQIKKPAQIADVPWSAEIDSENQKITMVQSPDVDTNELDINNVTEALNRKYQEIKINNAQLNSDTVILSIDNPNYLTQSMGTMGAEIFLADVTYSFTEIKEVKCVKLMFKQGDHASPGVYKRSNFTFKIIHKNE